MHPLTKLLACLAALLLAACQSQGGAASGRVAALGYAADFPALSCAVHNLPARDEPLTAQRVEPGAPAYIEFRTRALAGLPSGHMFVVFGRLDRAGRPATSNYIGLHPKGNVAGLYGGAIVPMPATVAPLEEDCTVPAAGAYRVSLTEPQYASLAAEVERVLEAPAQWHLVGYNCNHFAASLAEAAGLDMPSAGVLPAYAYLHTLIEAAG